MKCSSGKVGDVDGWHSQQWLKFLRESLVERYYHPHCCLWLHWQHHWRRTTACRSRKKPQEKLTSQASSHYSTAQEFNVDHMSCIACPVIRCFRLWTGRHFWSTVDFLFICSALSTVHTSLICMLSCHSNFTQCIWSDAHWCQFCFKEQQQYAAHTLYIVHMQWLLKHCLSTVTFLLSWSGCKWWQRL